MIGIMGVPIAEWNNLGKMCTKCTHSVFLKNFIFGYVGSSSLCGLSSSCGEWRLLSSCSTQASLPVASLVAEQALGHVGSVVAAGVQFLPSMWDLPGSGIKLMSPALAGRFFTTEPLGKPHIRSMIAIPQPDLLPCLRTLLFHVAPKYTLQPNTRNLLIAKCC